MAGRGPSEASREELEVVEIVKSLSRHAQELIGEVLRLEKEKLHMKNPVGVADDIVSLTERIVK